MLVGSVGSGCLVNLDFKACIGGDPGGIRGYVLLQCRISIGRQICPVRMRCMKSQKDARVIDRLARPTDWSGRWKCNRQVKTLNRPGAEMKTGWGPSRGLTPSTLLAKPRLGARIWVIKSKLPSP